MVMYSVQCTPHILCRTYYVVCILYTVYIVLCILYMLYVNSASYVDMLNGLYIYADSNFIIFLYFIKFNHNIEELKECRSYQPSVRCLFSRVLSLKLRCCYLKLLIFLARNLKNDHYPQYSHIVHYQRRDKAARQFRTLSNQIIMGHGPLTDGRIRIWFQCSLQKVGHWSYSMSIKQ